MKDIGEGKFININVKIRWEWWQTIYEKKSQHDIIAIDNFSFDIARRAVDLKNWQKEVDTLMGT